MSALVKGGKTSPVVRQKAVELTQHLKQKDRVGEVKALHAFVRDRIRYVRDVNGVETVHTPEQILRQEAGDCDDKALLLCALLEAIGHPSGFWVIGTKPGTLSHVLAITRLGNAKSWFPLETTEPKPFGWRPPIVRAQLFHFN